MPVAEQPNASKGPAIFRKLAKYSSSQVAAINAYSCLFRGASRWRQWIEEVFQELLQVPAGLRLTITQSNEIGGEEKQTYVFEQQEVFIGRIAENDISLPMNAISRRHARMFSRDGEYYIEDLQSGTGTYLNRQKLNPAHPQHLTSGDEVMIFPYVFRVSPDTVWVPDKDITFWYSRRFTRTTASDLVSGFGPDVCLFQIEVQPGLGQVILALGRPFLRTIVSRLMQESVSEMVESDLGLIEFIVLSILERANRELRFPFQFLLAPLNRLALEDTPGIALEAAVRLTGVSGTVRVFLPDTCLQEAQDKAAIGLPPAMREQLVFSLSARIGSVDLMAGDLTGLEPGDILVYTSQAELILPAVGSSRVSERGWRAERTDDPYRLMIGEFFERGVALADSVDTETKDEIVSKPELGSLPVRLHVVLSEVELSLTQLEGLSQGSVIELETEKTSRVRLVVNGRVLGAGDLVEVDDRLGVEITEWGHD
jgi:type III secretion system YscQ/HrcQ family protein